VKSRVDTGNRSRPGSSSSTGSRGSGGSRPGSRSNGSRPGSRGQQDPPYMPWLKKEAKSEIDNEPPFSHRSNNSSSRSLKSSSRPRGGGDNASVASNSSNVSGVTNIQRLAAQHFERLAATQKRPLAAGGASHKPTPPSRPPPVKAGKVAEAKDGRDEDDEVDDDYKLTIQSESDSDDDSTYSEPMLALDIGAINKEDEEGKAEDENNASFRVSDSFIKISGGFEIRRDGLQRTPKMSGSEANVFSKVKAGGGGDAKDLMVTLAVLGKGASGVVRKALHVPALMLVAQKVIPVFDDDRRHQMVRELKALYTNLVPLTTTPGDVGGGGSHSGKSSLVPCPHIVSLYEAYMDKKASSVTLVVEYMDGGSLQDIVETGGCNSEPVLANIACRVLHGLSFLHKNRQIHRDIKPANLLINHHGNVKVSDFGIVKDMGEGEAAAETFTGTFTYMSPERISGTKYSFSSDVWSLGLTLMTVALGKFPFEKEAEGGYWALLQALRGEEPVPPLNSYDLEEGVEFSDEFQDFLDLCLKKDPDERGSAAELLTHPFVSGVDLSEGGAETLEGDGSDTARAEIVEIQENVIEYYRRLWARQSSTGTKLTVPNFNKPKLKRLGRQIGLSVGIVQRKMRGVLKTLKGELMEHGLDSARGGEEDGSEYK